MAQGVYTRIKRFTFVEKAIEDVGDDSAYPMLVTLAQLAEIGYRVKDAWFTSGNSTLDVNTAGDIISLEIFPFTPPAEYVSETIGIGSSLDSYLRRSYNSLSPVDESIASYFGEPYDVAGDEFVDVADNERAMWLQNIIFNNVPTDFRCGFSHSIVSTGGYSDAPIGYTVAEGIDSLYYSAGLQLTFNGEVAWVNTSGSGNPFDPANSLYLGVYFIAYASFEISATSTDFTPGLDYTGAANINLVIELSSGNVSCPLYYGCVDLPDSVSGSDFKITATEWWPYAKNSPPVPVWDTATGLPA